MISLGKNSRLMELGQERMLESQAIHEETGEKVRRFGEFRYAAQSWRSERRVVMKAETLDKGSNPRFVVTNMEGMPAEEVYEFYCDRGDVENRIKEPKDDL